MAWSRQAGIILPGYNPLRVANAPTIGTATVASATTVSVAFTAPSCIGGGAISSYTAYANCGVRTASGASSPLTITGLTTGTAYTFRVIATNAFGPSFPSAASNSATPAIIGQQAYTTPGTFTWVAPAGVTSVSVVAVGGGGGGLGNQYCNCGDPGYNSGGGGGGLGYRNNQAVTPGSSYTVVVASGGAYASCQGSPTRANASSSYFINTSTVRGGGGSFNCGGGFTGTGGGNGGTGQYCTSPRGAGGAGGYAGNGGTGVASGTAVAGSGGGGGGGSAAGNGGGVGILGQGANGTAGTSGSVNGGAGSGGSGTLYGGGGGQSAGGGGAVRIIYPGTTRSFPSTNTGDL